MQLRVSTAHAYNALSLYLELYFSQWSSGETPANAGLTSCVYILAVSCSGINFSILIIYNLDDMAAIAVLRL